MVLPGLARAAAWALLPKLVVQYPSASAALRYLRSVNLGYRESVFRADWRKWFTQSVTTRAIAKLPPELKIPRRLITLTKERIPEKYMYRLHMRYPGIKPDEVGVKTIHVFSKELLTKKDILTGSELEKDLLSLAYDITEPPVLQIVGVFERGSMPS